MKRLIPILLALTILIPSSAGSWGPVMMSGGVAAVAGCVSCGSPTTQGGCAFTPTNWGSSSLEVCRATQFVLAATRCIVGIKAEIQDDGGSGTLYGEIWTDSGNNPSALVTGCSIGVASADIVNENETDIVTTFTFSSIQTLAAGTYWIVLRPSTGYAWRDLGDSSDAGCANLSRTATCATGTCGSWSTTGIDWNMYVYGCTP